MRNPVKNPRMAVIAAARRDPSARSQASFPPGGWMISTCGDSRFAPDTAKVSGSQASHLPSERAWLRSSRGTAPGSRGRIRGAGSLGEQRAGGDARSEADAVWGDVARGDGSVVGENDALGDREAETGATGGAVA